MDQLHTLLQKNFVISADILGTNLNVFNKPSMFYALLMFINGSEDHQDRSKHFGVVTNCIRTV
jgi:hypothetical protein